MGYQSDKQLQGYYFDLARKASHRDLNGNERAKDKNLRIARNAVIILLLLLFTAYIALHFR